jgi:putative transposase
MPAPKPTIATIGDCSTRAKEKGLPASARKAPDRLVEGAVVQGWKQALGALAIAHPDRIGPT